jgi:hypothetical protein
MKDIQKSHSEPGNVVHSSLLVVCSLETVHRDATEFSVIFVHALSYSKYCRTDSQQDRCVVSTLTSHSLTPQMHRTCTANW